MTPDPDDCPAPLKTTIAAGMDIVLRIPEAVHLRLHALEDSGVDVAMFSRQQYRAIVEGGGDPFSDE